MHTVYATDGLVILGVALVAVTVFSALRGLHARSAATLKMLAESRARQSGDHWVAAPARVPVSPPARRQRAA